MLRPEQIEKEIRGNKGPLAQAGIIVPDYNGYSICRVPGFIRSLFSNGENSAGPLNTVSPVPTARKVLFILLDGVGYLYLKDILDRFPDMYLNRLIKRGGLIPITSVFPASTATAISSYSTGLTPQRHGMLGYRLYLKETSAITNMIRLSLIGNRDGNSAIAAGIDVDTFLGVPTIYEQLNQIGVETHIVLDRRISKSGLSTLLYRGAQNLHPTVSFSDMLVVTRRLLKRSQGETFFSLYWDSIDALGHTYGPWTEEVTGELRAIDAALERELAGGMDDTLLIISSDHGFMTMEETDYLNISDYPPLEQALLLPPVGDTRGAYLFVREGRKKEVSEFLNDNFEGDLLCLDSRWALRTGLFGSGEQKREIYDRIGDLVVIATGARALYYPYKGSTKLKGMHGGVTPEEMLVPLIVRGPEKEEN
ncbi:MAG: alkaline phosphatase family protein [Candidatus Bipolaricaulota bacterium]|nr:alkaline phosphatase family protein [Candidatus Bipolaricaulota bacterium]